MQGNRNSSLSSLLSPLSSLSAFYYLHLIWYVCYLYTSIDLK
jgi:hypothetical protein